VLVYVVMSFSDYTILNLEIFRNTICEEGVKYAVSAYNISGEVYRKLLNRLAVLQYCLSIYLLII